MIKLKSQEANICQILLNWVTRFESSNSHIKNLIILFTILTLFYMKYIMYTISCIYYINKSN